MRSKYHMTEPVIFNLPLEVLLLILEYAVTGDNEAVLVSSTSKKWREVVAERRGQRNVLFWLTLRGFVRTLPLFLWARQNGCSGVTSRYCNIIAKEVSPDVIWMLAEEKAKRDEKELLEKLKSCRRGVTRWFEEIGGLV